MNVIQKINERKISIIQYSTENNWEEKLVNKNWLCVLIVNEINDKYISEAIGKILEKNVCWICTIGKECETVHDLIDEEIGFREVNPNYYLPPHQIMTTWHHDFEEGVWFAFFSAVHPEVPIENVLVIDMAKGQELEKLKIVFSKIKTEYPNS